MPNKKYNVEENSRMLCVYMRPWTLCVDDATADNPLLANMGASDAHDVISGDTHESKTSANASISSPPRSYAASWERYINGNVASVLSRQYIINLLATTTTPLMEAPGDSSDSSDDEDFDPSSVQVGSMNTVTRTLNGIRDTDEGAKGFGRYSSSIRLGRNLWQSAPLGNAVKQSICEPMFVDGAFPDREKVKRAFRQIKQAENVRPLPFANATPGRLALSVDLYGAKIDAWFAKVQKEKEPPTEEQWAVLRRVRDRVLIEYRIEKEGMHLPKGYDARESEEEPMRGLIHGPPGSGKSELIKFLRRFFEEALEWTHDVEFVFVAYQNRVAYAMKGATIHNVGMLNLAQQGRQLSHTDVDVLFTKNQDLKWVLIDEIGMVSDHLLGSLGVAMGDATNRPKRFRTRQNGRPRIFGGYNLLQFGDFQQLAPCPPGGPLFVPPGESDAPGARQERARAAKDMFWSDDADAINFFFEVKEQKRIKDLRYAHVMTECRQGYMSDESYCFLHGLPTMHAGSWQPATDTLECDSKECKSIQTDWALQCALIRDNAAPHVHNLTLDWKRRFANECSLCAERREERNRLLASGDPSVHQPPFVDAPYVHRNNEPKYVVANVRAQEVAKRSLSYCYWFKAEDHILNPEERPKDTKKLEAKLERFLQMHDMKTATLQETFWE